MFGFPSSSGELQTMLQTGNVPAPASARQQANLVVAGAASGAGKGKKAFFCGKCGNKRQHLFDALKNHGIEKALKMPNIRKLIAKAKTEGWICQSILVQSCHGRWVPVAGVNLKKRKRPTHEQMLDITKKHKATMTKRLELAEARIEALKMEIKVTEAAEMIMGLKAKSKAAKAVAKAAK